MKPLPLLSKILGLLLVFCISTPLFAGGGAEVETEIFLRQGPSYISPGNPETGKDTLSIKNIQLTIQDGAAIKRYDLFVYDKFGEVVYSVTDENLEDRGFFGELFDAGDIPSVEIPDTMVWNGEDTSGTIVSDGEYFYQLYVRDSFDAKAFTAPLSVVVDTVAPELLEVNPSVIVFSPNGDGERDDIKFRHRTTAAQNWSYQILNESGTVVWEQTEEASGDTAATDIVASGEVIWDGTGNANGNSGVQPEGKYVYRITGVDRAGNTVTQDTNIQLSTKAANLNVAILDGNEYFSRFMRESMTFGMDVTEEEGLDTWKLEVFDSDRIVVRRFAGNDSIPSQVIFNGKGNPGRPESDNLNLDDGTYTVVLSAVYENGNFSKSDELILVMDSTAPQAGLELDSSPEPTELGRPLYFGGLEKPNLSVEFSLEEGLDWEVQLIDESGAVNRRTVAELQAMGITSPFVWDGSLPDGTVLPDGSYQLVFAAVDEAGNSGRSNVGRFIKDTVSRADVAIELSSNVLSPGGDSGNEAVRITPVVPSTEGVEYFVIQIVNENGIPVFSRSIREILPFLEWPGIQNNLSPAEDGEYEVQMNIKYLNGDNPMVSASEKITLSRQRPEIDANVEYRVFTPDGDGDRDTMTITQSSSSEELWVGIIENQEGMEVKRIEWTGQVEDLVWDGLDENGEALPDGPYSYTISATNKVGNIGSIKLVNLRIDNLSASISVTPDLEVFSPNGDGFKDTVTFSPKVSIPENLRAWELIVHNESGTLKRSYQGGTNLPEEIVWDGMNDAGTIADGSYTATFLVEYANGTSTQRDARTPVILVQTPPKGEVTVAPLPFSPDDDGFQDEVTFTLDATASDRPIESWKVEIVDPAGNVFKTWEGAGLPPETLTWDGRNNSGELVQSATDYVVLFYLWDSLRNNDISGAELPVDILVIVEGNRLRILIPSINFAPYTADLFQVQANLLDMNLDTLRQLAQILNKYPEHDISIEGHAVHVFYQEGPQKTEEQNQVLVPLSRQRALEVKQALAILGVDWERMSIEGLGGSRPLVPHSDTNNRWKNRRVEFILERNQEIE